MEMRSALYANSLGGNWRSLHTDSYGNKTKIFTHSLSSQLNNKQLCLFLTFATDVWDTFHTISLSPQTIHAQPDSSTFTEIGSSTATHNVIQRQNFLNLVSRPLWGHFGIIWVLKHRLYVDSRQRSVPSAMVNASMTLTGRDDPNVWTSKLHESTPTWLCTREDTDLKSDIGWISIWKLFIIYIFFTCTIVN